ncbi:GyrI-like domain-containing protein [Marinilongibacter aquaticus]|uniref:GyrI-like domain-containing protein n=1 Tax=Marinilongibacter aquaticus TaxID=2975157 RepID=UPI0021BD3034|nr:GyrI-like domain-containing protein [Marinilongibacter aquaticus]UBM60197.1 GyrI-like domain-containing protein [Marinilongibacter aquaticus]
MEPRIVRCSGKKLVGRKLKMSLAENRIAELWQNFGPERKEIKHTLTSNLISMAVYTPEYFKDFKPTNLFEKWAAVEVLGYEEIPPHMESFNLPAGLYAVFDYKGLHTDTAIFQYIFGSWLPKSPYTLDDRPHFEVLGEKYKNNDPNSEEEIWIPIAPKNNAD